MFIVLLEQVNFVGDYWLGGSAYVGGALVGPNPQQTSRPQSHELQIFTNPMTDGFVFIAFLFPVILCNICKTRSKL